MKSLLVYEMKKNLILIGVILVIALVFYLGVKSGKAVETILTTGFIGGIASFFNWKRSSNNGRGDRRELGVSIEQLEGIRQRYRDADHALEGGLKLSRSEVVKLRNGLKRDRDRIRGIEGTAVRVREAANKLDELIERIQKEGID